MEKRIYLDYAAATPLDARVAEAMRPYEAGMFANAGAIHRDGQLASEAVFKARLAVAKAIGADFREIIFTASATEANNLALRGVFLKAQENGITHPKIIISSIEHESVRETAHYLAERRGGEVVEIPVDREGMLDLVALRSALDERTVIVSIHYAQSELGVVQDIPAIAEIVKNYKLEAKRSLYPLFHTDAAQAFNYLSCDMNTLGIHPLGVDMLTLSSHKIYGPKGVGALYVRAVNAVSPVTTGGGQEYGMRSGTENVPAIVGFGVAVEIAEEMREAESVRIAGLRDILWNGIKAVVPNAELNGSFTRRLPNNLNIYFAGRPAQDLCIELDMMGIAVSPGTACKSRTADPSYAITALGYSGDRPSSSLRLTLGRGTSEGEIKEVLTLFKKRFG